LLALAVFCSAQDARNPLAQDTQAAENGRVIFRIYCAPCHGIHAAGGRGPDLTRGTYAAGEGDSDLFRTIRNGVQGTEMPAFGDFSDDVTWRLVTYIRSAAKRDVTSLTGKAEAGEKLFWTKGGCAGCHKVGAKGGVLGPDLTRVGRQRSFAYLRESVVQPDADISPGYETITVVTRDGKKVVGVQRGYDNFSAQLLDMSGKFYSFDRGDVTSIQREFRSVMPGDYEKRFTKTELDDLLAYLTALKGMQ
jgi:cytochrome c oxidase cbb3-type subunit 3